MNFLMQVLNRPDIECAEFDSTVEAFSQPDDPYFSTVKDGTISQWGPQAVSAAKPAARSSVAREVLVCLRNFLKMIVRFLPQPLVCFCGKLIRMPFLCELSICSLHLPVSLALHQPEHIVCLHTVPTVRPDPAFVCPEALRVPWAVSLQILYECLLSCHH